LPNLLVVYNLIKRSATANTGSAKLPASRPAGARPPRMHSAAGGQLSLT